jgi:TetR/AcrR family transcriptional regulator
VTRERGSSPTGAEAANGPRPTEAKLELLLAAAAALMARKGYEQTTIRDVARETGFSLAGMYYYFENKEDLLYKIQRRTFGSLLREQEGIAADTSDATERLRRLVQNHLSYFVRHADELKVCTFELQTLTEERYGEIEQLRRRYYLVVAQAIAEILAGDSSGTEIGASVRHYTLFVFGMLNWIFMWFDEERDGPVERLGAEMIVLILRGLDGAR